MNDKNQSIKKQFNDSVININIQLYKLIKNKRRLNNLK